MVPGTTFGDSLPDWIKNTAGWWADDVISEEEFVSSIKYLITNQIIQIPKSDNFEQNNSDSQLDEEIVIEGFDASNKKFNIVLVKPDSSEIKYSPFLEGTKFTAYIYLDSNDPFGDYKVLLRYEDGVQKQLRSFSIENTNNIPLWIKNNAGWWAEGTIDDDAFIQGIQYLVTSNIIKIDMSEQKDNTTNQPPTLKKISLSDFSGEDWKPSSNEQFKLKNTDQYFYSGSHHELYSSFSYGGLNGELISELHKFADVSFVPIYFSEIISEMESREYVITKTYGNHDVVCIDSLIPNDAEWMYVCGYEQYILIVFTSGSQTNNEIIFEYFDHVFEKITNYHNLPALQSIQTLEDIGSDVNIESAKIQTGGVNSSSEGFSGLYCTQTDYGIVKMTGQYTNGPDFYSSIWFTLGILDSQGRIVATGVGDVSNIGPYQTKMFDATASWDGNFEECIIEIDFVVP